MTSLTRRALLSGLFAVACRPARTPAPRSGIAIGYSLDYPRVRSLELSVPPRGRAELWLHQPLRALAADPVGRFAADLPRELRDALDRYVIDRGLLDGSSDGTASPEGSGHIRLIADGQTSIHGINGATEDVDGLRRRLDQVVTRVATSPVAALRLTLEVDSDPSTVRITATLEHVGKEALQVLLYDPSRTDMGLSVRASLETRSGKHENVHIKPAADTVARLGLPRFPDPIAPGARYAIPLPPARRPEGFSRVTAMAAFHRPGNGLALRSIVAHAKPVDAS